MEIDTIVRNLNEQVLRRNIAQEELVELESNKDHQIAHLENLMEARNIIQKAAELVQNQLSVSLSGIVTNALEAVFDDPYEFKIDFISRRNSIECDLLFSKNGIDRKPLDSCGYGAADIASLALRVAYWKLQGSSRNVLILDEPTRNLSLGKQHLASVMIKKLSEMGIQFIIVTHNEDLSDSADKKFRVFREGDFSFVEEC